MPSKEQIAESVFAEVLSTSLSEQKRQDIRINYRAGRYEQVFPASSGFVPPLLVGRGEQIAQLSTLIDGVCRHNQGGSSVLGIVVHGPRGTGKTALLSALQHRLDHTKLMQTISLDGDHGLASVERFIGSLSDYMEKRQQETRQSHSETSGGVSAGVLKGGARHGRHTSLISTQLPQDKSIQSAIRSVQRRSDHKPLLILVDEAHGADPAVLGEFMNTVQTMAAGQKQPVGFVLAGTPDTLDVLRDSACKATWFRDRGQEKRFAPMPNDLSVEDCQQAIVKTLEAAGVTIEGDGLADMLARCKGSPYFLQVLGESALQWASRHGDTAMFTIGGEIDQAFEKVMQDRYQTVWADVESKNLSGCARQLGCLWRQMEKVGQQVNPQLIKVAIKSGLANAPYQDEGRLSFVEAHMHFKHLGLLWSITGYDSGPWSLGLPSFFDYVEAKFHEPMNMAHHAALPTLQADMNALFKQIGWDDLDVPTDLAR